MEAIETGHVIFGTPCISYTLGPFTHSVGYDQACFCESVDQKLMLVIKYCIRAKNIFIATRDAIIIS